MQGCDAQESMTMAERRTVRILIEKVRRLRCDWDGVRSVYVES